MLNQVIKTCNVFYSQSNVYGGCRVSVVDNGVVLSQIYMG